MARCQMTSKATVRKIHCKFGHANPKVYTSALITVVIGDAYIKGKYLTHRHHPFGKIDLSKI